MKSLSNEVSFFVREGSTSTFTALELLSNFTPHIHTYVSSADNAKPNILLIGFDEALLSSWYSSLEKDGIPVASTTNVDADSFLSTYAEPSDKVRCVSVHSDDTFNDLIQVIANTSVHVFDVILLNHTLYSNPSIYTSLFKRLSMISALLRRGGMLFLSSPFIDSKEFHVPHGSTTYEENAMLELINNSASFTTESVLNTLSNCLECQVNSLDSWTDLSSTYDEEERPCYGYKCKPSNYHSVVNPSLNTHKFTSLVEAMCDNDSFNVLQFSICKPLCTHRVAHTDSLSKSKFYAYICDQEYKKHPHNEKNNNRDTSFMDQGREPSFMSISVSKQDDKSYFCTEPMTPDYLSMFNGDVKDLCDVANNSSHFNKEEKKDVNVLYPLPPRPFSSFESSSCSSSKCSPSKGSPTAVYATNTYANSPILHNNHSIQTATDESNNSGSNLLGNGLSAVNIGVPPNLRRANTSSLSLCSLPNNTPAPENIIPRVRVVVSGVSLGLPNVGILNEDGTQRKVFDENNILDIFQGKSFLRNYTPEEHADMLRKNPFTLTKTEKGREKIYFTQPSELLKVNSKVGHFDLTKEFGVPKIMVEALDQSFQLAIAAGLQAMVDAGFPIFGTDAQGNRIINKLPPHLANETGVMFASSFPSLDSMTKEVTAASQDDAKREIVKLLSQYKETINHPDYNKIITDIKDSCTYEYNRKLLFQVLVMANSQLAELIGARGPNTQCNAACAGTSQAIAFGEGWIRSGRCKRVIVIAADITTSDNLNSFLSTGFMCLGAATKKEIISEAACPFDCRRSGMIVGSGAVGLVLESATVVEARKLGKFSNKRHITDSPSISTGSAQVIDLEWKAPSGWTPKAELLLTCTANSAYHASSINQQHITDEMGDVFRELYRLYGERITSEIFHKPLVSYPEFMQLLSGDLIYYSHETGTSQCAKVESNTLQTVFKEDYKNVLICNTKGFTGHPMSVNIENVMAVSSLHMRLVPPIANLQKLDPNLGDLLLSQGGEHDRRFSICFSAGFGSQFAITMYMKYQNTTKCIDFVPVMEDVAKMYAFTNSQGILQKSTCYDESWRLPPMRPKMPCTGLMTVTTRDNSSSTSARFY